MVKMNFTNSQTAFEYALYMIAASYFNKAKCKNRLLEKNMFLQYKEQKLDNQYKMEDICIGYLEKLVKELPEKVFKQDVEVLFRKKEDGTTKILFMNSKFIIEFYGVYEGHKSKIEHQIFVKKSDENKYNELKRAA